MNKNWVFDLDKSVEITEKRKEFLQTLLLSLQPVVVLKSGLDAGCGVGYFSRALADMGLKVTAFDVREENIREARKRHPDVEFHTLDVEDKSIELLGEFDLVLCFGLLYHLGNPLLAVRNLQRVTTKLLIVESMVAPFRPPVAFLMNENEGEDQGIYRAVFVSSESCLVKMLYHAGFPNVYLAAMLPDHDDFRETPLHARRRTVLVASNIWLRSPLLIRVARPSIQREDIWRKG